VVELRESLSTICELCDAGDLVTQYRGPIRYGTVAHVLDGIVYSCTNCGVHRLEESCCLRESDYSSGLYRTITEKPRNVLLAALSERLQIITKYWFNEPVFDYGCGEGILVDTLRSAGFLVNGYDVDGGGDQPHIFTGSVGTLMSFDVIEHVEDPRETIAHMKAMLGPRGQIILSTPETLLFRHLTGLEVLDHAERPFIVKDPQNYYCVQHRWYFNQASLVMLLERAGLEVNWRETVDRKGGHQQLYIGCHPK
jgi:2-polyprenyl-3-methyl-5-hydroxy-6-metoxy-1,4-benzoquinol methylase